MRELRAVWGVRARAVALSVLMAAGSLSAADLDLWVVEEAGGEALVTVEAGDAIRYRVVGELTADDSQGLASVVLDLQLEGGSLPPADVPDQAPMDHFIAPLGGSLNPLGFGGTPAGNSLLQVGGAQNWLGNGSWPCDSADDCPGGAPCNAGLCTLLPGYGAGELVTGLALPGSPLTLVRGGLVAPTTPGLYLLAATDLRATVVAPEASGDPWWELAPADEGSVAGLQIEVVGLQTPAIPALSPHGVTLLVLLLAGAAAFVLARRR